MLFQTQKGGHIKYYTGAAREDKKHATDQLRPTKCVGHWHFPAAQLPPLQNTPFTLPQLAAGATRQTAAKSMVIEKRAMVALQRRMAAGSALHFNNKTFL
jgi:hypothetical protein